MARPLVKLHGIREVNRAFYRIDHELNKELRRELKKVAEPVAANARGRISKYAGAITSTIQPVTGVRSNPTVYVRQKQGQRGPIRHGKFGQKQILHLIGAMYEEEDDIVEGVEDLLDFLGRKEGF